MIKTFKKALVAGAVITAVATMAPQKGEAADGTGNASATVLQALTVTEAQGLSFGSFETTAAGSVTISVAGARSSSGVTEGPDAGAQGQFTVTGTSGASINVSTPSAITIGNGTDTMGVAFDTTGAPTTLTGGSVTVNVGGTLTVAGGESAGAYTGTYTLTVVYQ